MVRVAPPSPPAVIVKPPPARGSARSKGVATTTEPPASSISPWIVEAAVDHLGVAAGDSLADVAFLLQDQDGQAPLRQRAAAGETDGPSAYDRRVEVEAHPPGP